MKRKNKYDLDTIQKYVSEKIKEFMIEKGITLTKLSKESGIPRSSLCNYLNCKRTMQLDAIFKIADYMNVQVDYLLGREDYL